MPSTFETKITKRSESKGAPWRGAAASIQIWNRKLHYYVGLYLLLFLWLFSVSGLLLNHPKWRFKEFWPDRKQSLSEEHVQPPNDATDLERARNLMRQLQISGEIEWTAIRPTAGRFDFQVVKPGQIIEIKADFDTERASIHRTQTNGWGVVQMLHAFSGVRLNDPNKERDWWLTKIWSFAMDAVVAGLLFLVLSSLYMWYHLEPKWRSGLVFLGLGALSCGFFVFGLGWL